jgi:chromosome segregation ATPase
MSLIFALQALLIRHESYVADAELNRRRMEEKLEELEQERRDLQDHNARMVEENRKLTDQLESLSTACAESELKILSLTELLRSTDQELERLTGLAARTEGLQIQLGRLEDEQASLHSTLATTKEEKHSVMLRWQKAERTVISLQDQIDRIERDAREERERHMEVRNGRIAYVVFANSHRSLSAWRDDALSKQNSAWRLAERVAP